MLYVVYGEVLRYYLKLLLGIIFLNRVFIYFGIFLYHNVLA